MDAADNRPSKPWREYLLLHPHEDSCLSNRLLPLDDVEVHLVTVEICVVGRAHAEIEPEGLIRQNLHFMGHDAHPVKRGLPVEENHIPFPKMSVNNPARLHFFKYLLKVL